MVLRSARAGEVVIRAAESEHEVAAAHGLVTRIYAERERRLRAPLAQADDGWWVAWRDGVCVATIRVWPSSGLLDGASIPVGIACAGRLMVDDEFQRSIWFTDSSLVALPRKTTIALAMLQIGFLDVLSRLRQTRIALSCLPMHVPLYEKLGFETYGPAFEHSTLRGDPTGPDAGLYRVMLCDFSRLASALKTDPSSGRVAGRLLDVILEPLRRLIDYGETCSDKTALSAKSNRRTA